MPTSTANSPQNGELYRAGTPALGPRLLAAAGLVRKGSVVADIGCDHGKLAVYLAQSGIAPRVIAADVRPMPLAKARALTEQTGCAGAVECRLGDGLSVLQGPEADDIIIAGMSGETMVDILAAAPEQRREGLRLVLVPATRQAEIRRWLCQNGFAIVSDTAVADAGRVYAVLAAEYTGRCLEPTPLFCEVGCMDTALPATRQYLKSRLAYLQSRAKAPLDAGEKDALIRLIREVEQCLK